MPTITEGVANARKTCNTCITTKTREYEMTTQEAIQQLARHGYTIRLARRNWKQLSAEQRELLRIAEAA